MTAQKPQANGLTKDEEEAILVEMRSRFDYAKREWAKIRATGKQDVRALIDPWPAAERAAREAASRPCLHFDELGQYVNQLINEVRLNKRAIKVSPRGFGANDKTAELRANKFREIEYRSKAQMVYTTMAENAFQRSYGFMKIEARYVSPKSDEQELWLVPVVNPDLITPDPDALMPDGSDWKFLFDLEWLTIKEFNRAYKDAEPINFDNAEAQAWLQGTSESDGKVQVGNYWTIHNVRRVLYKLKPPPGSGGQPIFAFEDELPEKPSAEELDGEPREVDVPYVCNYHTNGVAVLEKTEWPGQSIPYVACYGKVLYVDAQTGGGSEKMILSLQHNAIDAQLTLDSACTAEQEVVQMTPKTPYWAYEGQLSANQLLEIQKSLHTPVAVLLARGRIADQTGTDILPLPVRQPYQPQIEPLEVLKESCRRSIQAAIGAGYLPSEAQKRNEKSGIALKQIENAAQKGSYHYIDHYEDAIVRGAVILDDLMSHYYRGPRQVAVRALKGGKEVSQYVDLKHPQQSGPDDPRFDLGEHDITISTGPAFDDEREMASDFADTIIGNLKNLPVDQEKAAKLLAMAITLKNVGEIGTEMAKIISPPQSEGEADPQALQAKVQELGGQLQALTQSAQAMQQVIETKKVEQQAKIQTEKISASKDITIQKMRDATSLAVAQINASVKIGTQATEARNEAIALAEQQAHEHALSAAEAGHDEHMAQIQAQHAKEMAEIGHAQALEQGDQGIQGQLAVQDNAPQPEAGA